MFSVMRFNLCKLAGMVFFTYVSVQEICTKSMNCTVGYQNHPYEENSQRLVTECLLCQAIEVHLFRKVEGWLAADEELGLLHHPSLRHFRIDVALAAHSVLAFAAHSVLALALTGFHFVLLWCDDK